MINYENREYKGIWDIKNKKKIALIFEKIPTDVKTIIDVGCGNGLITNELAKKFKVVGTDINESKLENVKTEKVKASCDNIDFPDESFDLVFSSEVLEHLDDQLLANTLKEFDRLSSKYILITVPNREPLHKMMVKCASCGHVYNKNGHLRSFHKNNIGDLFEGWELLDSLEFGAKVRNYHKSLATLKQRITSSKSWIPGYWIKGLKNSENFCTNCGARNELSYKFNPIATAIDTVNILTTGKFKSHLMALYKKK